ncbi:MAG TPA: hypothetical protein VFB54_04240 [Burkholderiales bacterium]|nr:hypothetical protein [Burkholderiales bacterium]
MRRLSFALLLAALVMLIPAMSGAQAPEQRADVQSLAVRDEAQSVVRGVVRAVDPRSHSVSIRPEPATSGASADRDLELIYNDATVVEYQGKTFNNPQDIEVGDRVEAQFPASGARVVQKFKVLSSVSEGGTAAPSRATTYEGTIGEVDRSARTFQLLQRSRENYPVTFRYSEDTKVEYQGRSYRPEDLERGDSVRITASGAGSSLSADRIVVTESAGSSAATSESTREGASGANVPSPGSAAGGTSRVEGVIRAVNKRTRTIDLDRVARSAGPDPSQRMPSSVQFDRMTVVEYRGKRYGIENLEPGDEVAVDATRSGEDYLADRIVVVRPR